MPINVTVQSNQGTYQGGTYQIGPLSVNSTFAGLQTNAVAFSGASFVSTTGPAGAFGCLIVPPTGNLVQLTLKGITGDTGIPIAANLPTLVSFFAPASANSIGLTSAGAITGNVELIFF